MTDVRSLRNVLRCTSTFVPDVGYVQASGGGGGGGYDGVGGGGGVATLLRHFPGLRLVFSYLLVSFPVFS